MPVVKDVVAHLGIAKQGPMVRYSRQGEKVAIVFSNPGRQCL